jgi:hypothetical protein
MKVSGTAQGANETSGWREIGLDGSSARCNLTNQRVFFFTPRPQSTPTDPRRTTTTTEQEDASKLKTQQNNRTTNCNKYKYRTTAPPTALHQ